MVLAKNKKINHDYKISEKFEAGLVLSGPEVKSCKKGSIDMKGSYIAVDNNSEAWLTGCYVAPYKPAQKVQTGYDPYQKRKLLLKKKEINFLMGKEKESGTSVLPLTFLLRNNFIKLEIGIGQGKKKYDKREDIKKRDFERRKRKLF
jgi:SsrA-binding protein